MQVRNMTALSSAGLENFIFPFGELMTGEKEDDVSVQFQYNQLNYDFDLRQPIETGAGGTIANENSYLTLTGNAGGDIAVSSKNSIHYVPGKSGYAELHLL